MRVKLYHSLIILLISEGSVVFLRLCVFSLFISASLARSYQFYFSKNNLFHWFFFHCFLSFNFLPLPCFGFFYFLRLKEWVTDFKPFLFSYNYLGPFVSANVLYSPLLLDSDQPKGMCVTGGGRVSSQLNPLKLCAGEEVLLIFGLSRVSTDTKFS